MKKLNIGRGKGFTIMELMIVLIIIALLLALAYPSYVDYARKAKRGQAQQLLLNWAINQEIWRSNNPAYADETELDKPTHDDYTFADPTVSATAYLLTANGSGDQTNDKARDGTSCGSLSLNENGVKLPAACWE